MSSEPIDAQETAVQSSHPKRKHAAKKAKPAKKSQRAKKPASKPSGCL